MLPLLEATRDSELATLRIAVAAAVGTTMCGVALVPWHIHRRPHDALAAITFILSIVYAAVLSFAEPDSRTATRLQWVAVAMAVTVGSLPLCFLLWPRYFLHVFTVLSVVEWLLQLEFTVLLLIAARF